MTLTQAEARVALAEVSRVLDAQRARLLEIAGQLPAGDGAERGQLETAAQLRGTIECIVADRLAPAVISLRAAGRKGRTGSGKSARVPASFGSHRLAEA